MRFYRFLRGLFLPLLAVFALVASSALAENLLVNPGFDRDLGGWTAATSTFPDPSPFPGYVEASLGWTSSDASASALSGGTALHARANVMTSAKAALTQCAPVSEGMLISFGAKFLTVRQYTTARLDVTVSFFSSADCSGAASGSATASQGFVIPHDGPVETNSGGLWSLVASEAVASAGARSVLFEVGASAHGTSFYGLAYVDAVADDVVLMAGSTQLTTWLLPSAAWVHGAGGSYWKTRFTLCNPGSTDAVVTFKWLGHDVDGRGGPETAYVVHAGRTFVPDENTWWVNHPEDYDAILVTSSSPALVVQSETSTPSAGGTVGQALPAFGSADFAGATPKTFAPIRENASFRTNLVLANATEAPLTAHVAVFNSDGTLLGSRDVDLAPFGMTQINRVAAALGASTVDLGRIAVSTATPGGLVAAYASVIDNETNDPRTLLPQNAPGGTSAQNLLVNPGFDRDFSGWDLRTYFNYTGGNPGASATWDSTDALSGNSGSVRFQLRGFAGTVNRVLLSQCVAAVPGRRYTGGGLVRTEEQMLRGVITRLELFTSAGCAGNPVNPGPPDGYSLTPMLYTLNNSDGRWLPASVSVVAGTGVQSLRFSAGLDAVTYMSLYTLSSFDGLFDEAFLFEQADPAGMRILPSSAKVSGAAGSSWTTALTLSNASDGDALVTLKFLGHDVDGLSGREKSVLVQPGTTVVFPDVLASLFERTQDFGAILVTSSSPALVVQSETSTPSSGGTVGQALPAFGPADFAGATPKTLAPIRENADFRTNLVLANATEGPLAAHVDLFAADGTLLGARDVDLPPLGMTQIGHVAAALGVPTLDVGRIAVSTPTPGGLVATYASVIDNSANDPRTLLPR